ERDQSMVVLLAALFMSLGLINLDFGRNWWRGQLLRLAIGFPLLLLYAYVQMPPLVFPQALTLLLLTFIPNAAYSALLAARNAVNLKIAPFARGGSVMRRALPLRRATFRPYLIGLALLLAFAGILAIAPIVDASGLRDIANATISNTLPPSADLKHIRVVPEESAIFAGDKVIGQLGSYYRVGDFNVQVERGSLVWVAPLEFQGLVQWLARRTSPGVIVVSAENPDQPAELRQRAPMRYIPSALLNDNLYRHVYMTYGTRQILELTLQLDDQGSPQYLATLGRPTIGWSGQVVTGVVIVDPATGAMRYVARADFATLPKWVSRVYPDRLALIYNEWFGKFIHGLWNYLLAKRDVHVPARNEVFGLLAGPQFVWFVDHTSPAADQSMTGFTYMDTVTGKMTYYTSSGGEFNSRGAENAVASNPIVRQGRLIPTQPLLYNAFGQNTWVVPLVADSGKYQSLALVQAKNGHVIVGTTSSSSPQSDAFAQYAAFLSAGTGGESGAEPAGAVALLGQIDRVATGGNGVVYFTLEGSRRIFAVDGNLNPAALLARHGDRVFFHSAPSTNGEIPKISDFRDPAVSP
ncbi:MAG TPA: hypothetical protein VKG44_06515, partial [Candidatus Baltobacteraceae bacterium]|nr:hypothetical protein [Candidatus Baltobacteraceae bacterium]